MCWRGILGHVDDRMVQKHYGHLTQSYLKEAIRAGAPNFGLTPDNVTPVGFDEPKQFA